MLELVEQLIADAVELAVAAWVAELGAQKGHRSVLLQVDVVEAVTPNQRRAWVAELEAAQEGLHAAVAAAVVAAEAETEVGQRACVLQLAVAVADR